LFIFKGHRVALKKKGALFGHSEFLKHSDGLKKEALRTALHAQTSYHHGVDG